MKAMILAAGLGTRLKPITDKIPKALVEVDGVPMLERVILSLKAKGFDYIVVNVHHFAPLIVDLLKSRDYGVDISISDEKEELLDTGGGIVKASGLLFKYDDSPVLVHNVDILSNADLPGLMAGSDSDTTLLVSDRESSRKLIFDANMIIRGWHDSKHDVYRPAGFPKQFGKEKDTFREYAFSGIYVIGKDAVEEMRILLGEGKYSVMDYFLSEKRKSNVKGNLSENLRLLDIGKPASLARASEFI